MKRVLILLGSLAGAAAIAGYFQSTRLSFNGQLASTGVIERNGVAYVPIKDIAAAMHLKINRGAGGYELTDSGGANQIEGVTGKVGDVLWNGYARFQVIKIIRGKTYTNQFSGDHQEITPNGDDNDVVVLVCRIKNGMGQKQTCALPGGTEVGLTDTDEHSYGPRTGLSIDCPSRGQELLPGAAVDFALTFDVLQTAKLKDLVYQVEFYGTAGPEKKKFRVSLQ